MNLEISKVADTLIQQCSIFQCSVEKAWEDHMHPLITESIAFEEVKAYIDNKIKLGEKVREFNQ